MTRSGRFATLPLHLGGFIGPFGGAVLAVLVPELRDAFDATTSQIALAVPAYLVPFALLQLVSGTFGERAGRRRTVQVAYFGYALASIATALAPSLGVFLVGRAVQGAANAFTTPLVMAALADVVPRERLGRSIGTFAGVQAAGISFAPLLGGLAAEVSWRLAFFAPAVVALGLMLVPPKDPEGVATGHASLRELANARMARLMLAACAGYLGFTGLPFLVSLRIDDAFGLEASTARPDPGRLRCRRVRARQRRRPHRRPHGRPARRGRRRDHRRGVRAAPRLRLDAARAGARVDGRRGGVGPAVGGAQHDRGRVVRDQPRRRRLGLPGVEVRRRGRRAADAG